MNETDSLKSRYTALTQKGLNLNLTRGKPGADQIELAVGLDEVLNGEFHSVDGTDTRNYGGIRGIPEIREIGAHLLGIGSNQVLAGGNSSLNLMYIVANMLVDRGLCGPPLRANRSRSAICPAPGYDRHFVAADQLGFKLLTVSMTDTGPDMDQVEHLVRTDVSTNFIWCVPKHSNPTGCTYDTETVNRLAALPAMRADTPDSPFYVLWDNAYSVHDFAETVPVLDSIDEHASKYGTNDYIVQFASTSKITFAGSGVSFLGGSEKALDEIEKYISAMTVGFDKVNQLRHARFLQGPEGIKAHMAKHAEVLRPKFAAVQQGLAEELGNRGIANWTDPTGGYFVSLDVKPGTAKLTAQLASEAGLAITPAGATFPYGDDPRDSNLRIAPTFASLEDVVSAIEVLGVCVRMAAEQ